MDRARVLQPHIWGAFDGGLHGATPIHLPVAHVCPAAVGKQVGGDQGDLSSAVVCEPDGDTELD